MNWKEDLRMNFFIVVLFGCILMASWILWAIVTRT